MAITIPIQRGIRLDPNEAKVMGFGKGESAPVKMESSWGMITITIGAEVSTVRAKDFLKAVHFLTPDKE